MKVLHLMPESSGLKGCQGSGLRSNSLNKVEGAILMSYAASTWWVFLPYGWPDAT